MRYINIDTISFTNKNGVTVPIKDKRPIPEEQISFELKISDDTDLDEIASRADVFGEDAEDLSYRIFDANIIEIVENGYDLSKIRKLSIPL